MSMRKQLLNGSLMALTLFVAACSSGDEAQNLADLDAKLTNNTDDPVLRDALEGPLAVDPQLSGKSNRHAVRDTPMPPSGAAPITAADAAAAAAEALKKVGGKLLHAPAAQKAAECPQCDGEPPVTLGAVARQGNQQGKACVAKLDYGTGWMARFPEPFLPYPRSRILETAGSEGACAIRAASFVAPVKMQAVLDYYYTQARRAGFDGEHLLLNGAHVLGGTRAADDGAYFINFADAPGGGTTVDIVVNNGR